MRKVFPPVNQARVNATGRGLGCLGTDTEHFPRFMPPKRLGLPVRTSNRAHDTPIRNQGSEGSCTAFMAGGLSDFFLKNWAGIWGVTVPAETSEQAIYYWERALLGTTGSDSGGYGYLALEVMEQLLTVPGGGGGLPDGALWPYWESLYAQPSAAVVADAARRKLTGYVTVPADLSVCKASLAAGIPFGVDFIVYSSWYDGPQTVMPWPPSGGTVGGHSVVVIDYDDTLDFGKGQVGYFIIRNSWGTGYGDGGYFYFPYAWMTGNEGVTASQLVVDGTTFPFTPATRTIHDVSGNMAVIQQLVSGGWRLTSVSP